MPIIQMFLMVLALVFFFLATLGIPSPSRLNFIGAGLFSLTLAALVEKVPLR